MTLRHKIYDRLINGGWLHVQIVKEQTAVWVLIACTVRVSLDETVTVGEQAYDYPITETGALIRWWETYRPEDDPELVAKYQQLVDGVRAKVAAR